MVAETDVCPDLVEAAPQIRAPLVRDGGHGLPGHAVRPENSKCKFTPLYRTDFTFDPPDSLENAAGGGYVVVGRRVVEDARLVEDEGDDEADDDADDDDVGEARDVREYQEVLHAGTCKADVRRLLFG